MNGSKPPTYIGIGPKSVQSVLNRDWCRVCYVKDGKPCRREEIVSFRSERGIPDGIEDCPRVTGEAEEWEKFKSQCREEYERVIPYTDEEIAEMDRKYMEGQARK